MTSTRGIVWRGEEVSRLVLGTVQLGMPYGIANVTGQPSRESAARIVAEAWEGGIRFFDTAQGYGQSEEVLGEALAGLGVAAEARIVTKLSPGPAPLDAVAVRRAVEGSLGRLGAGAIWGIMLHAEDWLDAWDQGLGRTLEGLRGEGLVRYLGVSVYSAVRAKEGLGRDGIDIVQVPANAWDGRMEEAGVFDLASRSGKLCFVRSIYLQGLLTLRPEQVAQRLPAAEPISRRWHGLAESMGLPPRLLAMRFALGLPGPLVVGAETPQQVRENLSMLREGPLDLEAQRRVRRELGPVAEDILNPSRWPAARR